MNIPKGINLRPKHKREDGKPPISFEPEFQIWNGMLGRCLNPRNKAFHRYGGAGITVCERWTNFWLFIEDMGRRPTKAHSIDRMENSKGYEPGNCRWATRREQTLNRDFTRFIEFDGRSQCLTDWANEIGMSASGLSARLNAGWSAERALTTPPRQKDRTVEIDGIVKTFPEIAQELGIGCDALYTRIKRWGLERALSEPKDRRFVKNG
jgi:hypothetical protein